MYFKEFERIFIQYSNTAERRVHIDNNVRHYRYVLTT